MDQQRPSRAWAGLSQLLCRHRTQREPRVHQPVIKTLSSVQTPLQDRAEPGLPRVADALIEIGEGMPVVQVGDVDGVASGSKFIGEHLHPNRQPLCVVVQHDLQCLSLRNDPDLSNVRQW